MGVDPVVTGDNSSPVGVDHPEDDPADGWHDGMEGLEGAAHKVWSWITDKFDEVWGKINGGSDDTTER